MPIEEWLIRIAMTILIINIFSLGMYCILRGYYKNKSLNRLKKINGRISRIHKHFRASVTWYWMGQEVLASEPSLFAFSKKETIPIFVTDNGMNFHLNIWTHNGKGLMISGVTLCLSALFLMIVLV